MSFLARLRDAHDSVISVELRPPRAELESAEGIDAWIDTYHAIKSLARQHVRVMITDSAVGAQEENNLRHLVANLGAPVARANVVPFLTCKHSLDFCLGYADQAAHHGFESLVVLGGDKHVGRPRCVEHAWQLRKSHSRASPRARAGRLGESDGAARRSRSISCWMPRRTRTSTSRRSSRIIRPAAVSAFIEEARRRGLTIPAVFGVFFYRSAESTNAGRAVDSFSRCRSRS